MKTKSISVIAALAGISIVGSFSLILLNEIDVVSDNEEEPEMTILENSFCPIFLEEHLEYDDIKTGSDYAMRLSLFLKNNSTANLCFSYYSEYDNEGELKLEPEIYKREHDTLEPYTGTDITVISIPDSIPLQKGFISIVAYQINTLDDANNGVYYITIPQTCGALFPIVVDSKYDEDSHHTIKLQKGAKHCGSIMLNVKMIGTEGGILDYAKIEYVR